ncbi:Macro_domain-containing protein [Hexamita inflata]|uniref:Macro domain-containing protein n=1 Tax=Hexamita inflata TaxID=28002 RepID=A0AA86U0R1_9EUKA|nr:Macro domain-containing protein [Hexamita inflata]
MSAENSENSEQGNNPVAMDESVMMQNFAQETRNPWDMLRGPLKEQLKFSRNVLWSEAAKARFHAHKAAPAFKQIQSTARIANLGSLTNLPKANTEINKRLCVVQGDICQMKTDALIVPMDDSELNARVHSIAGEELEAALKRQTVPLGDTGLTASFQLQKEGFPSVLFHCNVPKKEDPTNLKQAYDRAFYMADLENVGTIACPVLSGVSYPLPGQDYYPLIGAVHVMLSSVRQQFEKAKAHQFNLVVIVCANDREKNVVNELMELYFPHDPENELEDELIEEVKVEEVKVEKKAKKGKSKK